MPKRIESTNGLLPAGYSLSCALDGENLLVQYQGFYTSSDGSEFIDRVEALTDGLLDRSHASQVDHLLAICHPDGSTTVYCNELAILLSIRAQRDVVKGEHIRKSDVADIREMRLKPHAETDSSTELTIPDDCGVLFLFSVGWRKALYFDFSVFGPNPRRRRDNLAALFASFYSQLAFHELHHLRDEDFARLSDSGWFPFICLPPPDREKLIAFALRHPNPEAVYNEVCDSFARIVPQRLDVWKRAGHFQADLQFIERAVARYLERDYISCISILYPRLEGIIRRLYHGLAREPRRPGQGALIDTVAVAQPDVSVLLPRHFADYLKSFFFRNFDEHTDDLPLSRHSIGHGVARAEDFDYVKASIGFMILDQLLYYRSTPNSSHG